MVTRMTSYSEAPLGICARWPLFAGESLRIFTLTPREVEGVGRPRRAITLAPTRESLLGKRSARRRDGTVMGPPKVATHGTTASTTYTTTAEVAHTKNPGSSRYTGGGLAEQDGEYGGALHAECGARTKSGRPNEAAAAGRRASG